MAMRDETRALLRRSLALMWSRAAVFLCISPASFWVAAQGRSELSTVPAHTWDILEIAAMFVAITVAWLAPRWMAGGAVRQGRPGKWMGLQTLLLLFIALPVVAGALLSHPGVFPPVANQFGPEEMNLAVAALVTLLSVAVLPMWVRVDALAISGDLVSRRDIGERLHIHGAKPYLLFAIATALAMMPPAVLDWLRYAMVMPEGFSPLSYMDLICQMAGTVASYALCVALYLEADRGVAGGALEQTFR